MTKINFQLHKYLIAIAKYRLIEGLSFSNVRNTLVIKIGNVSKKDKETVCKTLAICTKRAASYCSQKKIKSHK